MAVSTTLTHVPLSQIIVTKKNPRKIKPKQSQLELNASVKESGVLVPILVRPIQGKFQLVAGERRLTAARAAKLKDIPANVREMTASEAEDYRIIENLQREDIDPIDEAIAIVGRLKEGDTVETLAKRLGKAPSYISRRASLAGLSTALMDNLRSAEGTLREWGVGCLELLSIVPAEIQDKIFANNFKWGGPPTLKKMRELLSEHTGRIDSMPWDPEDAELVPEAGVCSRCPMNSANAPGLYDSIKVEKGKDPGVCRDQTCWRKKQGAFLTISMEKAKKKTGRKGLKFFDTREGSFPKQFQEAAVILWRNDRGTSRSKGAIPGVALSGPKMGRLVYKKPQEQFGSGKAEKKPDKGSEADLKLRRFLLQSKRDRYFIDEVRDNFTGGEFGGVTDRGIQQLALAYGFSAFRGHWNKPETLRNRIKATQQSVIKVHSDIWVEVCRTIAGELETKSIRISDGMGSKIREADWLAHYLWGSEYATALRKSAKEAIPVPAILAKLEGREPAPPKAKKKATKKKVAKKKTVKRKAGKKKATRRKR